MARMKDSGRTFDPGVIDSGAIDLGATLRRLRRETDLTLEQLAARSGLSRSAISKIERGQASPSHASLLKLAAGLGRPIEALLGADGRPARGGYAVSRARVGSFQETPRFRHRLLAPDFTGRRLYAFETDVVATSPSEYEPFDAHPSEDVIYVLAGRLTVHLPENTRIDLDPGDAIQMDGRLEHALTIADPKTQDGPTRILWVTLDGALA